MRRVVIVSARAGLAVALIGCQTSNDRTSIGNSVSLEAISGTSATAGDPTYTPSGLHDDPPSITSLDRSNWEQERFLVPVDGTAHQPTYATRFHFTDDTARQRGEYPTVDSVLEETDSFSTAELAEAGAAPFIAAFDVPAFFVRVFYAQPWDERYSPQESYQRTPEGWQHGYAVYVSEKEFEERYETSHPEPDQQNIESPGFDPDEPYEFSPRSQPQTTPPPAPAPKPVNALPPGVQEVPPSGSAGQ